MICRGERFWESDLVYARAGRLEGGERASLEVLRLTILSRKVLLEIIEV